MFRKIASFLALAALCLMAATAFAGVTSFTKFKVNVPNGWSSSQDGDTVILIADDKSASVSITVASTNGMSLKDLADAFVKQLKGGNLQKVDDDGYTFTFKAGDGPIESTAIITSDDKEYFLFVTTGEHAQFEDIMNSIEDK